MIKSVSVSNKITSTYLMISCFTSGPIRPELGHHHPEDGDEEEGVGGEKEEHWPHVDPLVTGRLHEGALVVRL